MTTEHTTDDRSVETAWTETIRAELPVDEESDVRRYVNRLFGTPLLTMTDPGPDETVVLVDRLLERTPPTAVFGVEDALTDAEWADLKERLVAFVSEGVQGRRRGPASVSPYAEDTPPPTVTASASEPDGPATPDTTASATSSAIGMDSPAPTAKGFPSDAPDLDEVTTPTDLARAVNAVVEAAGLEPARSRQALSLVMENLEDDAENDHADDG